MKAINQSSPSPTPAGYLRCELRPKPLGPNLGYSFSYGERILSFLILPLFSLKVSPANRVSAVVLRQAIHTVWFAATNAGWRSCGRAHHSDNRAHCDLPQSGTAASYALSNKQW